jgi:LysM repeat protein
MSLLGCIGKWWPAACLAVASVSIAQAAGARAPDERRATHTVQPGDVLSVIAQEQGVSLADLRRVNGLGADTIRPGQVLLLPTAYVVQPGDVPGVIAERHGLKLSELYRYNDLKEGSVVRVGQRLIIAGRSRSQSMPTDAGGERVARGEHAAKPVNQRKPKAPQVEYYLHEVQRNEVLSAIAARYAVPTKDLCQINRLKDAALIRVGQRLKIPVTEQNARLTRPRPWSKYARKTFERGRVTLTTPGGNWTGRVLDKAGNVLPEARQHIEVLLASWETGHRVQIALHPRLYQLIVTVSDEFGGRPIRVVSGYRERSYARDSKHRVGRALDFSIPGVPNTAIVDFLLTLPKTGVGYYPNVTHVHMDVRDHRMYWVDVSGPGQPPHYVHRSNNGQRAPTLNSTSPSEHALPAG